ncbi:PAAR domain-containing protein [Hafnia alvei]|uniref:Zn-binding Pro-Ala-Ala-Arg (PAAR) domain-containing protein, incolved in TypeVI secretion n=1 Tax=Hafnia alvei TaxID=569 RepID=A0A1C6Z639_HAFAL|nr:PAAR domain-containing protein [Hafnia alvei]NLS54292.1 PAAR domain-containing protein [Hafnia alvei]SCM54652.1 Zn-binding Pro-Ala-Ala-Arg (PAAR) domain-containing protein, incolved in TypeVI secretion [Hafnia alvei]
MRCLITQGCPTSTGGKVLQGMVSVSIKGLPVTVLGMQASCAACKGVGAIVASGPRFVSIKGTLVALEGDIVSCACPRGSNVVLPQIVTVQAL